MSRLSQTEVVGAGTRLLTEGTDPRELVLVDLHAAGPTVLAIYQVVRT